MNVPARPVPNINAETAATRRICECLRGLRVVGNASPLETSSDSRGNASRIVRGPNPEQAQQEQAQQ